MIKMRLLVLSVVVCVFLPVSTTQTQTDNILSRDSDESARTVEERQSALATLIAASRQFQNVGDSSKAARLLNRAGSLQLKLYLLNEAMATYQSSLALVTLAADQSIRIDSLNGIATVYGHLSKCSDAKRFVEQAITLSEQTGYLAGKAEALFVKSYCQNPGDHPLAVRTAQEALEIWQSLNLKSGIAKSHAAIGDYQLSQNNLMEATKSYETALNLWRELNDPAEEAEALISLGFIEYRKGSWQSVMALLTQAQGMLDEKAEPYKMGQISAGLAEAFIESGVPETGLGKLMEAREYYRLTRNPLPMMVITWDIGRAHYLLDNYSDALANLEESLIGAESIDDFGLAAMCHDFLGRTSVSLRDLDAGMRHFQIAIGLYTSVGKPMEAARTQALMGQVYEAQGSVAMAREYYQTALKTLRSLADAVNESATLYALGRLELKQENLNVAEEYLIESIEITEDMRRVSTSSDLTAAFSATVHERYEAYIECLMRKHKTVPNQSFDVRAFETSELSRGRALVELLQATQTSEAPGLDPQLAGQEKSLRQSLRVKEDSKVRLLASAYKKEEIDAVRKEIAALDAQHKQVLETIRSRYPSFEQINRPTGWDVRQIQENVIADDETLLLEYSLGAERSYVWAVTRDRISSHELPAQNVINEVAQKVYKLLATAPTEQSAKELDAATQELSRMVLLPVATDLNKRRILIVADGALNYIPFQILASPSVDGDQLLIAHEIVNAPSASVLGQLRQEKVRRQPATNTLAAFGDPVFTSNYAQRKDATGGEQLAYVQTPNDNRMRSALRDIELNGDSFDPSVIQPLFYAKQELANLREVAGDETLLATGFDASREKLQQTDLTKYSILHFATHGVLDPKRPENSGLFLSTINRNGQTQDGFVGLSDIYNLRAPVDLVVLSACRTGLGKDVRGEGLIGITRGFMYAGASSVVASLWKVDDEATAELMKIFYRNMLERGMTPAAALREAQKSIRQQPQWRSPYYWAAFTLQGDYRQVIKPRHAKGASTKEKIIFGFALLVLVAGATWWYRSYK